MAGLITDPAFHASSSVIGGTWPSTLTVSIHLPFGNTFQILQAVQGLSPQVAVYCMAD